MCTWQKVECLAKREAQHVPTYFMRCRKNDSLVVPFKTIGLDVCVNSLCRFSLSSAKVVLNLVVLQTTFFSSHV